MSSRELGAWVRLLAILVVYVPYFLYVMELFRDDAPTGRPLCIAFVVAGLAMAVVSAAVQVAARLVHGPEQVDERDRAIEALSLRVAYFALLFSTMAALGLMALLGVLSQPSAIGTILLPGFSLTSQYVFFSLVVAEVLRHVTQLVAYRHAAWMPA